MGGKRESGKYVPSFLRHSNGWISKVKPHKIDFWLLKNAKTCNRAYFDLFFGQNDSKIWKNDKFQMFNRFSIAIRRNLNFSKYSKIEFSIFLIFLDFLKKSFLLHTFGHFSDTKNRFCGAYFSKSDHGMPLKIL